MLIGNTAIRNGVGGEGFGFFLRDSSHGTVIGNRASRNCIGFLFLDTGSPGPVSDWTAKGNTANRNNGACPAGEEGPPTSGTGIGLVGTDSVEVTKNHVFSNRPSIDSPFAGGIVAISATQFGGAELTNNLIARNVAFHNKPADIVWDKTGTGNRFKRNLCATSMPAGICGGH